MRRLQSTFFVAALVLVLTTTVSSLAHPSTPTADHCDSAQTYLDQLSEAVLSQEVIDAGFASDQLLNTTLQAYIDYLLMNEPPEILEEWGDGFIVLNAGTIEYGLWMDEYLDVKTRILDRGQRRVKDACHSIRWPIFS